MLNIIRRIAAALTMAAHLLRGIVSKLRPDTCGRAFTSLFDGRRYVCNLPAGHVDGYTSWHMIGTRREVRAVRAGDYLPLPARPAAGIRRRTVETAVCVALTVATVAGVTLAAVSTYGPGAELAPAAASSHKPDGARRVALEWLTRHPGYLTLPSCATEDASSGPIPCTWNVHRGDGNGRGVAYIVTGSNARPTFHYLAGGAR